MIGLFFEVIPLAGHASATSNWRRPCGRNWIGAEASCSSIDIPAWTDPMLSCPTNGGRMKNPHPLAYAYPASRDTASGTGTAFQGLSVADRTCCRSVARQLSHARALGLLSRVPGPPTRHAVNHSRAFTAKNNFSFSPNRHLPRKTRRQIARCSRSPGTTPCMSVPRLRKSILQSGAIPVDRCIRIHDDAMGKLTGPSACRADAAGTASDPANRSPRRGSPASSATTA